MNVRALIFGVGCAIAAVLALFVSFSFELSNPTWAVTTVFITSQPVLQGGAWGKGFYRIAGTVVSLAVALLIIPNLVDAPEMMMLALAAWLGICLYIALLDRSPRAYGFMLCGYTATLIGLPVIIGDPGAIFDTAIARTEEILIGVGAATVVQGLLSPFTARRLHDAKVQQTMVDARGWIINAATGSASPEERHSRRALAISVGELVNLGMALRFELPELHGLIRTLEDRLVALLPLLSAVEDRREALLEQGLLDEPTVAFAQEFADWVKSAAVNDEDFERLMQTSLQRMPQVGGDASPKELLELNFVHRITLLAGAWRDCVELTRALREPSIQLDPRLAALVADPAPRALHRDRGIALRSALVAALSIGVAAAFGMLLQWPSAIIAIGLAAVASSLFATLDDPTPAQSTLLAWIALAIPLSAAYVFAVLPALDGFFELTLCLFPLYTALGYFMAQPKFALQGTAVMLATTVLVNLQPAWRGDFVTFITTAVAVVVGGAIALVLTQLLRVIDADVSTRRLLRRGWTDVAAFARWPQRQTVTAFAMRMLDRLGLLMPRAARATPTDELRTSDVLRDLQIGFNVSELAQAGAQLPSASRDSIDGLRKRLAMHFEALSEGTPASMPIAWTEDLEVVIRGLLSLPRSEPRDRGIVAVVGLRRNMQSLRRQLEDVEGRA